MTDRSPQNQDKFIVRLPDGMRDRIRAAAHANNRSMNAEIVATLEEKYPDPVEPYITLKDIDDVLAGYIASGNEEAVASLKRIRARVVAMIAKDYDR